MGVYRTLNSASPQWFWRLLCVGSVCAILGSGCAMGARTELAAADAIDRVAESLAEAVGEYHGDLTKYDDSREEAVTKALAARLREDATDDAASRADIEAFLAAMVRLRTDRSAAQARLAAAMEHIAALREVASGLRRLAVESMSLDDEMRRYLLDVAAVWRAQAGETAG